MNSAPELNRAASQPGLPGVTHGEQARPRLDALDWVRGLVMLVMVLDHARDFLGAGTFNPRDVNNTALFLTRWVTHFCAPSFVFLAGISAYLYGARGRTRSELSWFLLTRGLWLIFAEFTFIRFAWAFHWQPEVLVFQVIWVIGVSFLVLSGLVYLPRRVVGGLALLIVVGHNLLDHFSAGKLGAAGWVWLLFHEQGVVTLGGKVTLMVIYPLVPWIAVATCGYCLGPVMEMAPGLRRRWTLGIGSGLVLVFVLLRGINGYGDPQPWVFQKTFLATLLSFLNCEKYPPSLLYLAMTLGPTLLLLSVAENFKGRWSGVMITYGRVPFLFYFAHIVLLHAMAIGWAQFRHGNSDWLFAARPIMGKPAEYGLSLPWVYGIWFCSVIVLYPLCRWFANFKQKRRDWWLSYL